MTSTSASPSDLTRGGLAAYPVSRWYVIPITRRIASRLTRTAVRPTHITLLGLLPGLSAAGLLFADPAAGGLAAALVLAAWFADRTDGLLARSQHSASPFGAWLDANVDELHDVVWHTAAAYAAAALSDSRLPWFLLIGFLAGKYLFITGLAEERTLTGSRDPQPAVSAGGGNRGWIRTLYHLPGNSDIRLHLLIAGLATGWMTAELAFVAAYYNFRWIARFGLTARRLEGCR